MYRLTLSLTLLIVYRLCAGQPGIMYQDDASVKLIGREVSFYKDPGGTLTLNEILEDTAAQRFEPSASDIPHFQSASSPLWVKFTVNNRTGNSAYLLIDHPRLHYITFYVPEGNGNYTVKTAGYFQPVRLRDIPSNVFYLKLPTWEHAGPVTFYLKIESKERIVLPMYIGSAAALSGLQYQKGIFAGAFLGILLITILYNLLIYLVIRERSYLYHLIRIVCLLLMFDISVTGLSFTYIFPDFPQLNYYRVAVIGMAFISEALFCMSFLKTRTILPALHKGLYGVIGLGLILILMNVTGFYSTSNILNNVFALVISFYLAAVAGVAYFKKFKGASFYLAGWFFFIGTNIIYILMLKGVFTIPAILNYTGMMGVVVAIVVTNLGLGYRTKLLREKNDQVRKEKLELTERYNEQLSDTVDDRAKEIAAQQEEIMTQNEALRTQHDVIGQQNSRLEQQNKQLAAKNSELDEARMLISLQHQQLQEYTSQLEQLISERTRELKKTNQELIDQNLQLKQFSYITAHNLRAPVARLLGLSDLLYKIDEAEANELEIKEKIVQTSRDLDEVIHDVAGILEMKKGSTRQFELVSLKQKLHLTLSMLDNDIQASGARINYEFSEVPIINSLPAYIESIFFNLISNAIKYRSHERKPVIEIDSALDNEMVQINFKDNGIGLDVERYKDKLFGLYQRFNVNVEGKGLGLHLVKSQVESLGGTILVSGQVGHGTQFTILLPKR